MSKSGFSSGFRELYNERQIEYSEFKKFFAEKGEPLKDTLVWEFGKKIASLAIGYPNPVESTRVSLIASDIILTCDRTLREIFKKENIFEKLNFIKPKSDNKNDS